MSTDKTPVVNASEVAPPPNVPSDVKPVPFERALITNKDVMPLLASQYFKPTTKGLEFRVDDNGDLITIPREELENIGESLGKLNEAHTWWLGDWGAAIKALYGDEAVEAFFQRHGIKYDWGIKLISVSKAFGFPDRIKEERHPDPKVTHSHHSLVQGIKDKAQRMRLLQEASDGKMNTTDFYTRVKEFKKGTDNSQDEPEYGTFHMSHKAFDPKKDNKEQYLTELIQKLETQEYPDYIDPERRKLRMEVDRRKLLIKKLPEKTQERLLSEEEYTKMSPEEFTKFAIGLVGKHKEKERIKNYAASSMKKNDKLREEMLAKQKEFQWSFDTFKEKIKQRKQQLKDAKTEEDKITTGIAKITDAELRSDLYKRVEEEKLTWAQIEPLLKELLVEQYAADEVKKINDEKDKQLANVQAKAQQKVEGVKKSKTSELPLGRPAVPVKNNKK